MHFLRNFCVRDQRGGKTLEGGRGEEVPSKSREMEGGGEGELQRRPGERVVTLSDRELWLWSLDKQGRMSWGPDQTPGSRA